MEGANNCISVLRYLNGNVQKCLSIFLFLVLDFFLDVFTVRYVT